MIGGAFTRDPAFAKWVVDQIPEYEDFQYEGWWMGLAFLDGEDLLAGILYTNYRGNDCEMTIAAKSAKWSSRTAWAAAFHYPFNELGCSRVTAITNKKNKRVRRLLEFIGFKLEGVVREGFDNGDDACLYGLLKRECKYLKEVENG